MARRTARRDAKAEALRADGALHPRPERVRDPLFGSHDFFDPGDLVEASHAFPFPIRCVRIVPQPREVRRQRENARAGIGVDGEAIRLPLPLIDRLGIGQVDDVTLIKTTTGSLRTSAFAAARPPRARSRGRSTRGSCVRPVPSLWR